MPPAMARANSPPPRSFSSNLGSRGMSGAGRDGSCSYIDDATNAGTGGFSGLFWGIMMLVSSTGVTIFAKLMYDVKVEGEAFNKPYWTVFMMKVGMSCAQAVWLSQKPKATSGRDVALVDEATEEPYQPPSWGTLAKIVLPSFMDLANTVFGNLGLLYLSSSIYQMTRGILPVFCAIVGYVFLGKAIKMFQFWALFNVVVGVALTGVAGFLSSASDDSNSGQFMLGCFFLFLCQFICGFQIVVEEYFMTELNVSPLQLTAYEGFWGVAMYLILIPILTFTPGGDPSVNKLVVVYHEDFRDTFDKLSKSPEACIWSFGYFVTIALYNASGQTVTKVLGGVLRCILEAVRSLFVWGSALVLWYGLNMQGDQGGEEWTQWSWLQMGGFLVLVYGTLAYRSILPGPCKAPVEQ